jgi:hypothetical protein
MLFGKIIPVDYKNHVVNVPFGQNAEFMNVTIHGMYIYHYSLNSYHHHIDCLTTGP